MQRIQPTYEELKPHSPPGVADFHRSIQPTYEELKHHPGAEFLAIRARIQPTYEELKLVPKFVRSAPVDLYPAYL